MFHVSTVRTGRSVKLLTLVKCGRARVLSVPVMRGTSTEATGEHGRAIAVMPAALARDCRIPCKDSAPGAVIPVWQRIGHGRSPAGFRNLLEPERNAK